MIITLLAVAVFLTVSSVSAEFSNNLQLCCHDNEFEFNGHCYSKVPSGLTRLKGLNKKIRKYCKNKLEGRGLLYEKDQSTFMPILEALNIDGAQFLWTDAVRNKGGDYKWKSGAIRDKRLKFVPFKTRKNKGDCLAYSPSQDRHVPRSCKFWSWAVCEGAKRNTDCNIDGQWGSWEGMGDCSETCGEGTRMFTRQCDSPPQAGTGADCVGAANKTDVCNYYPCPEWTSWVDDFTHCNYMCYTRFYSNAPWGLRTRKCALQDHYLAYNYCAYGADRSMTNSELNHFAIDTYPCNYDTPIENIYMGEILSCYDDHEDLEYLGNFFKVECVSPPCTGDIVFWYYNYAHQFLTLHEQDVFLDGEVDCSVETCNYAFAIDDETNYGSQEGIDATLIPSSSFAHTNVQYLTLQQEYHGNFALDMSKSSGFEVTWLRSVLLHSNYSWTPDYSWSGYGPYGPCEQNPCGFSAQYRTRVCLDVNGSEAPAKHCAIQDESAYWADLPEDSPVYLERTYSGRECFTPDVIGVYDYHNCNLTNGQTDILLVQCNGPCANVTMLMTTVDDKKVIISKDDPFSLGRVHCDFVDGYGDFEECMFYDNDVNFGGPNFYIQFGISTGNQSYFYVLMHNYSHKDKDYNPEKIYHSAIRFEGNIDSVTLDRTIDGDFWDADA